MRRLSAAAVLIGGLAGSALAQRGGSHGGGGFSGHGAATAGSGFNTGSRFSYGAPRPTGGRASGSGLPAFRAGSSYRRPVYGGGDRYRSPYVGVPYSSIGVFGYPIGYPDWMGQDDSNTSNSSAENGSGFGGAPVAPYAALPDTDPGLGNDSAAYAGRLALGSANGSAYRSAYVQPRPAPAPPPANEEAVTLVFKDGRPPEQIHNYILSRTAVHVWDGHPHEVSLEQLDLSATVKANKDAGLDFEVPGSIH